MELTRKPHRFLTIISVVLVLLGIYGSARTAVNFAVFEKYPVEGVFDFSFWNQPITYYPARENDCAMSPMMYYKADGVTPREPSALEKQYSDEQKRICLENVAEIKRQAKVKDISQSLIFLFLGSGLLVSRKFFEE